MSGEIVTYEGSFNELKCFKSEVFDTEGNLVSVDEDYRIFNYKTGVWDEASEERIADLKSFAYSYDNMPRSVHLNIPYTHQDSIQIYAFNYANQIEHPLEIHTIETDMDHPILTVGSGRYVSETDCTSGHVTYKETEFEDTRKNKLASTYLYGKNTLRVWCNGLRIYPNTSGESNPNGILESVDGSTFTLPEPVWGKITYVIELPENNQDKSCSMEILDHTNLKAGTVNIYQTEQPLFPGRINLYLNGIRQPEDSFTIMDNYTLLINGDTALIGNTYNFPEETVVSGKDTRTLHHEEDVVLEDKNGNHAGTEHRIYPDRLLVEVRQDERIETTLKTSGHPVYEINVLDDEIDATVTDPADEIMLFVNGLYFGASRNNGYSINKQRGTISITDADTLAVLNTDEMMELMTGSPDTKAAYLKRHTDPYTWKSHQVTLEWR